MKKLEGNSFTIVLYNTVLVAFSSLGHTSQHQQLKGRKICFSLSCSSLSPRIIRWFQGRTAGQWAWQRRAAQGMQARSRKGSREERGREITSSRPHPHDSSPTRLHLPASQLALNASGEKSSDEYHIPVIQLLPKAPPVSPRSFWRTHRYKP